MYDWNHLVRNPGDLWVRDVLACIQERGTGESLLHVLAFLSCWDGINIRLEGVHGLDRWPFLTSLLQAEDFQTCDVLSDVHVRDADGRTPLHLAIRGMVNYEWTDAPDLARRLITLGADCEAADHQGLTPLALLQREIEIDLAQGRGDCCTASMAILRLFEDQVLRKAALAEQPEVQRVARRRL
ncbi:ankyrin repeat domain-containing protein [Burkholderia vietnamiensis]|uniref:hypothetical protein n=1 Tax=Burkholderia vietnamiensis TaxID=60552 RepID=UPI001CF13A52|nr:hypothetical protein [Burkholderia vietnamiensis]MCA8448945.1 hypothetical protein [Burkholderia vietnamiensis]